MTPQYRVLPAADLDLDEQAAYFAQEATLDTALRFYDAAAETFADLARMPGMGEQRETINDRLAGLRVFRMKGFARHLIFYRPVEDGIEIVRVLHSARDIDRVLNAEGV